MVQFDGVIFDLDGTLVDTLEDIADAMDRVLALEGAPGHTYEEYRYLIGHGIRNLVSRRCRRSGAARRRSRAATSA